MLVSFLWIACFTLNFGILGEDRPMALYTVVGENCECANGGACLCDSPTCRCQNPIAISRTPVKPVDARVIDRGPIPSKDIFWPAPTHRRNRFPRTPCGEGRCTHGK